MTSEYPHLPNAPIIEALIDLRVLLQTDFNVRRLQDLHACIEADYPRLETQHLMQGRFQFTGEKLVAEEQDKTIRGFRMLGDEGRNIVQFRRDGFTFSRLSPYKTWQALFDEGSRLWQIYRDAAHPQGITRLATRFINRIQCPPTFTLEDYFTKPPDVPEGVPDVFTSFLQRYVLHPVDGVIANVTLATETSATGEDLGSVLFDIDCYVQEDVSADDDEKIQAIFLKLWDMKNRIFFKSLTLDTLKAFE
jgi:uncharacterized protein (TIGR04255 family)